MILSSRRIKMGIKYNASHPQRSLMVFQTQNLEAFVSLHSLSASMAILIWSKRDMTSFQILNKRKKCEKT